MGYQAPALASPASLSAAPAWQSRQVTPVEKTDGKAWDREVVRALITRLPGGTASVTTKCAKCSSMFYPCLCAQKSQMKNSRILVAPRIVRISERMRLGLPIDSKAAEDGSNGREPGAKTWGHLRAVMKISDRTSTDKNRVHVSSFDDPLTEKICECGSRLLPKMRACKACGKEVGPSNHEEAATEHIGRIIWRQGERYLVAPDNTKPWVQTKELDTLALQELKKSLGDHLTVERHVPMKKGKQAFQGCMVEVEYKNAQEATGDMELSYLQDGYYVQALLCDGIAHRNGVRGGHLLGTFASTDAKVMSRDKQVWVTLDACKQLPAILRPLHECAGLADTDELDWPIRLQFYTLPKSWVLVGEAQASVEPGSPTAKASDPDSSGAIVEAPSTFQPERLDELIKAGNGARLQFKRETQFVIIRSHMDLRHEHFYERENATRVTREDDYNMLVDWGLKSRLTPAQLAFAFKKMADSLYLELEAFGELEATYEKIFLAKSIKCMEIAHDLGMKKEEKTASDKLNYELSNCTNEFQALCQNVPFSFLVKVSQACSSEDSNQMDTTSGSCAAAPQEKQNRSDPDTAVNIGSMRGIANTGQNSLVIRRRDIREHVDEKRHRAGNPLRERLTLMAQETLFAGSSGNVRHRTGRGAPPVSEDEVLKFIEGQIDEYFHSLSQHASDNPSRRANKATTQEAGKSRDGRLTFREFVRVMFDAGICWLNSDELLAKFEALDTDKSGKLNLAEVFSAANRMQQLVERAREFERREKTDKGRKMNQVQVMSEFARTIQRGEDLSAMFIRAYPEGEGEEQDLQRQVNVRVSSGTLDLLNLDRDHVVWVAGPNDQEKWIEWDLGDPCYVTAVVTRGHPEQESWVSRYAIEFWEERRLRLDEPQGTTAATGSQGLTYFDLRTAWENEDLLNSPEAEKNLMLMWESMLPDEPPGKWVPYKYEPANGFAGNTDHTTSVENDLIPHIETTFIRLLVLASSDDDKAALRATIFGYHVTEEAASSRVGASQAPAPSRHAVTQQAIAGTKPVTGSRYTRSK